MTGFYQLHNEHRQTLKKLEVPPGELGSYPSVKDMRSMVAGGCVESLLIMPLCARAC